MANCFSISLWHFYVVNGRVFATMLVMPSTWSNCFTRRKNYYNNLNSGCQSSLQSGLKVAHDGHDHSRQMWCVSNVQWMCSMRDVEQMRAFKPIRPLRFRSACLNQEQWAHFSASRKKKTGGKEQTSYFALRFVNKGNTHWCFFEKHKFNRKLLLVIYSICYFSCCCNLHCLFCEALWVADLKGAWI